MCLSFELKKTRVIMEKKKIQEINKKNKSNKYH